MMTLYSVGYSLTRCPFGGVFSTFKTINSIEDIQEKGVLLLHGGEDISPSIYGERPVKTNAKDTPSTRDSKEIELFKHAVSIGMPIIGICRGHQLAACLSGHSLWQHVNGHLCTHNIVTYDNQTLSASADHHQAVRLNPNVEAIVLAVDTMETHAHNEVKEYKLDEVIEAVYYPNTNCLGFQPHPEWMTKDTPFVKWCGQQIKKFLIKE